MNLPYFRKARREDITAILALMMDGAVDQTRENGASPADYERAFSVIDADANQLLAVAERDGVLVATMQLTFIPGLSWRGAWRMQLENVRVRSDLRGQGLGKQMMAWALAQGRSRGCTFVQLTTHKTRTDAQRFYKQLGFQATHEGMKLVL